MKFTTRTSISCAPDNLPVVSAQVWQGNGGSQSIFIDFSDEKGEYPPVGYQWTSALAVKIAEAILAAIAAGPVNAPKLDPQEECEPVDVEV